MAPQEKRTFLHTARKVIIPRCEDRTRKISYNFPSIFSLSWCLHASGNCLWNPLWVSRLAMMVSPWLCLLKTDSIQLLYSLSSSSLVNDTRYAFSVFFFLKEISINPSVNHAALYILLVQSSVTVKYSLENSLLLSEVSFSIFLVSGWNQGCRQLTQMLLPGMGRACKAPFLA